MIYDVIIIGAGPAGISAGLYTKRANLKVLIIYKEKAGLEKANLIENYYGFEKGITGTELYQTGIKQAKHLGIDIKKEEVINVQIKENGEYKIITENQSYDSKAVIFATGNKKNVPKIKGIKEFEGKGVSYCAICDAFFYRNKDVAVIGNGNYAIHEANHLKTVANSVTILTNGKQAPEFRAENVDINTEEIEEINGEKKVEEIILKNHKKIETDGIFIAQGVAGSTEFAKKLGIITKQDKIVVNEKMETNVKGIYACGDCTGGLFQVSKAVYEGTIAGLQVINYIREKYTKGE